MPRNPSPSISLTLAAASDCGITSQCGLHRILHLLYAAATVLSIALAVAIVMAIYFYRRNKRSEVHRR